MSEASREEELQYLESFPDHGIETGHAKIPTWLIVQYIIWPIWGIFWFYFFWNGNMGWLDRGYWHELQKAANTTFPIENASQPPVKQTTTPN